MSAPEVKRTRRASPDTSVFDPFRHHPTMNVVCEPWSKSPCKNGKHDGGGMRKEGWKGQAGATYSINASADGSRMIWTALSRAVCWSRRIGFNHLIGGR